VALTHVKLEKDKRLASLPIDLILGGHDHTPYELTINGTLIQKCGQDAQFLGVVDINIGNTVKITNNYMINTEDQHLPADTALLSIVERWRSKFSEEGDLDDLCKIIDAPLCTKTAVLRTQACNFGCLVADSLKWYFIQQYPEVINMDTPIIGVINGGFIRADNEYKMGTMLNKFQCKEEMPFKRHPILLELTGQQFTYAIEEMIRDLPEVTGAFPHFSNGFECSYDPTQPPFQRISNMKIQGKPLQEDSLYHIATQDSFYTKKCDGVVTYQQGIVRCHPCDKPVCLVVIEYLAFKGEVSGILPDRFLLVQKSAKTPLENQCSS